MNKGLFEPTVMFFEMCNSPATFQSMMDAIFADMIDDNIVIIYMDDIFIYALDEETLVKNTRKVLERLRDNDLFLKPTKCELNKSKVEYLGMVIEERKILMDSGKLKLWKTQGNTRLANSNNGQTSTSIPWIWQLLSVIHLALL